jgi:ABC-type antimicrobial peptide transport system permease subunit
MGAFLPGIYLTPEAMLTAVGIMIASGVIAGIFPALKAMRLSIIDALARA